jgi:hypothetical protein
MTLAFANLKCLKQRSQFQMLKNVTLTPLISTPLISDPINFNNPAGSFTPAACNDWHDVLRFHVGTDHYESTRDAGYTTARASVQPKTKIILFAFWGSPYTRG